MKLTARRGATLSGGAHGSRPHIIITFDIIMLGSDTHTIPKKTLFIHRSHIQAGCWMTTVDGNRRYHIPAWSVTENITGMKTASRGFN